MSHVTAGPHGPEARMVDVGSKEITTREAVAEALVRFPAGMLARVLAGEAPKGPVIEVARVAAIQAAKRTGELIPMCHPLGLDLVELHFETSKEAADCLRITCKTKCSARTGVEMEALVGASVAALTVYDMSKALSKEIEILHVRLLSKMGGKSGVWHAK